jgi:hypothetical protein
MHRPGVASPSSRGLGHRPFTAVTGVRIPLGTPIISIYYEVRQQAVSRLCPVGHQVARRYSIGRRARRTAHHTRARSLLALVPGDRPNARHSAQETGEVENRAQRTAEKPADLAPPDPHRYGETPGRRGGGTEFSPPLSERAGGFGEIRRCRTTRYWSACSDWATLRSASGEIGTGVVRGNLRGLRGWQRISGARRLTSCSRSPPPAGSHRLNRPQLFGEISGLAGGGAKIGCPALEH